MTQIGATLAVLALGAVGVWLVFEFAPTPQANEAVRSAPLVRVQPARPETIQLRVATQGTVAPRTEIELVPEIGGRVTWVSPALWAGGFFAEDEPLVRIDRRDFEFQVTQAKAEVARARVVLTREEAEAETVRREWHELEPDQPPPPLAMRLPQLAQARAQLAGAQAHLKRALLDLSRTEVLAPFAGRARSKRVDVGQFVTRGGSMAELYAVDFAEVRLPLPDEELAFLELSLERRGPGEGASPRVVLSAEFGGATLQWEGEVVRVEGEIDTRTRMVHAVARVADPYGRRESDPGGAPLAAGMFVNAEIYGRTVDNVIAVPRGAVREGDEVLVVEPEVPAADGGPGQGRLRFRPVEVLRREREQILVTGGLVAGDLLCVSPLEVVTDGMRVAFEEAPMATSLPDEPNGEVR